MVGCVKGWIAGWVRAWTRGVTPFVSPLSPPSCVCAQDAYFSDDSVSGGCADGSRRARKPATRVEAIRRVQANSRGAPMRASSADDYDY